MGCRRQKCRFNRQFLNSPNTALPGGLADEKIRWEETIETLTERIRNVVGDLLLSAGNIAYLGIFSGEYRNSLMDQWEVYLSSLNVPLTPSKSNPD